MTSSSPALALLSAVLATGCVELDGLLLAGEPASLEDYDFTSPELDGIDPSRIASELIPARDEGQLIHALFVERDATKLDPRLDPDAGITILFSHGSRQNMLLYWYRVAYFEEMGFNVAAYDYRGYGASTGEASEERIYEDVVSVYDWVARREGVSRIVSFGYSMGGAPALYLCSRESGREVAACITEAAFASTKAVIDAGTGYDLPSSFFLDAAFDNESRIRGVTVPILIMHGKRDERVAFDNASALWAAAQSNNAKNMFVSFPAAGHRNVPIPSYAGADEPKEYSHPRELPPDLRAEFDGYGRTIAGFLGRALEDR